MTTSSGPARTPAWRDPAHLMARLRPGGLLLGIAGPPLHMVGDRRHRRAPEEEPPGAGRRPQQQPRRAREREQGHAVSRREVHAARGNGCDRRALAGGFGLGALIREHAAGLLDDREQLGRGAAMFPIDALATRLADAESTEQALSEVLDAMIAGGLPKILRVRGYVDALRGGL